MKRKLLAYLFLFFISYALSAQDTILKTNGDEIQVKVTDIGISEVKYHRFDNLTGPVYTLNKSEIVKITYEDGSQDVFGKPATANKPASTSVAVPRTVSATASTDSKPVYIPSSDRYRRSSLYSILIKHAEKEFCSEIVDVFNSIPVPDKFDDHNLKIRAVNAYIPQKTERKVAEQQKQSIDNFLTQNDIGRRLTAKWFNRDSKTGVFDMDLVAQRGLYDASALDIRIADKTVRGRAMLADAGEELIGNTFIIVNDIRYVDKEEQADVAAGIFGAIALIGSLAGTDIGDAVSSLATVGAVISEQIAGFKVNVTSYLYRLNWTEEIAGTFYQNYYVDKSSPNLTRKTDFDNDRRTFTVSYVGSQTVSSGNTTLRGINTNADELTIKREMIKKVCTRAIDASIVQLQRNYDEFKIKTPLIGTAPITASIGRKEGVNEESKYEVLEKQEDANGHTSYKRVGIIKPVKSKIWDNRYLATEEGFAGAGLGTTEFTKLSGGNFFPGMLVREIK